MVNVHTLDFRADTLNTADVPEPTSMTLAALGALGMAAGLRNRRRQPTS
ncbi:MAG: PEP-CTERM sorting domain-containing protein [Planctomycetaceae bacterium]|nr:PEP-CTERM sorting domain-containing protein [Planctomycetaceae bacterium]